MYQVETIGDLNAAPAPASSAPSHVTLDGFALLATIATGIVVGSLGLYAWKRWKR